MVSSADQRSLQRQDKVLINNLKRRLKRHQKPQQWRNLSLFRQQNLCATEVGLKKLRDTLERAGGFSIRLERVAWRDTDGERRPFTLARATSTEMWPMGTHYWVRDNAIIGARYLFARNPKHRKQGKELLLSALTFISSSTQLDRFEKMIASSTTSFRRDPANWPYIFAAVRDNLNASLVEGWAHKQDAWQIAIFYVIEAIEQGLISVAELSAKHKKCIGLVIPFLAKVEFWRCENSGSWEEIPAVRTSVRAWEHRLLVKLAKVSALKEFAFLRKSFDAHIRYLAPYLRQKNLDSAVLLMERKLIKEMLRDLPKESPAYKRTDARYRAADGALIYLLTIDYPYFLAARLGKEPGWAHRLEAKILAVVESLTDPVTGAIRRYRGDCYQRTGYFRSLTIAKLAAVCGAPSGDASGHFLARNKAVPKGREAAWTHFVWQLAAWSGQRFLDTGSLIYRRLHDYYFLRGMALFTGAGEATVEQDAQGTPRVIGSKPLRMPECYISEKTSDRRDLVFPSPHTPLNWAVAEMFQAFDVRKQVLMTMKSVKETAKKR
ncbi:MAG: hypothetical protein RL518_1573 [Pseudomonadota bacterium]